MYIAKSMQIAEQIRQLIEDGGMLVKIRPIVKNPEGEDSSCEILVPESEVEMAHNLIIDADF